MLLRAEFQIVSDLPPPVTASCEGLHQSDARLCKRQGAQGCCPSSSSSGLKKKPTGCLRQVMLWGLYSVISAHPRETTPADAQVNTLRMLRRARHRCTRGPQTTADAAFVGSAIILLPKRL